MNLLVKSCLRKRAYTEAEARQLVRLTHQPAGRGRPAACLPLRGVVAAECAEETASNARARARKERLDDGRPITKRP